jgi:hypothetical protein
MTTQHGEDFASRRWNKFAKSFLLGRCEHCFRCSSGNLVIVVGTLLNPQEVFYKINIGVKVVINLTSYETKCCCTDGQQLIKKYRNPVPCCGKT